MASFFPDTQEPGHWLFRSSFGWHDCAPYEDDQIAARLDHEQRVILVEAAVANLNTGGSLGRRVLSRRRCACVALDLALALEAAKDPRAHLIDLYLGWAAKLERG